MRLVRTMLSFVLLAGAAPLLAQTPICLLYTSWTVLCTHGLQDHRRRRAACRNRKHWSNAHTLDRTALQADINIRGPALSDSTVFEGLAGSGVQVAVVIRGVRGKGVIRAYRRAGLPWAG